MRPHEKFLVLLVALIFNVAVGLRVLETHQTFVREKIKNDSSIAKDTKRIADLMENKCSGSSSQSLRSSSPPVQSTQTKVRPSPKGDA